METTPENAGDILGMYQEALKLMNEHCETFDARIYVGLRPGYGYGNYDISDAEKICKDFVNEVKHCVTVTPTHFYYVDGHEPGVIVGLIKYPRIEYGNNLLHQHAAILAMRLMYGLEQYRVTVVTTDRTFMLTNDRKKEPSKQIKRK